MKLHQFFTAAAVGLATVGQLIPLQMVQAAEPGTKSPTKPSVSVLDVSLTNEGALKGEVFNSKRDPVKNAVISVRQGRNEVAQVSSDENGQFAVEGLKAGVYYIVAGTGHGVYRVWGANKAPNKTLAKVKVISDRGVVRAQNPDEGRILYDNNGVAYGQVRVVDQGGLAPVGAGGPVGVSGGGTFLGSLGIYDAALLGLSAGALTTGIIAINEAQDAKDAANQTPNSP